jgi:hypothetical protein
MQREIRQIELINVEASCGRHVPTILTGKIYSKTVVGTSPSAKQTTPTV